ncbi:unnamed protein product [Meloidogyne enterolobii]|uniref:Uncharacterized protein n=1 Tax=Meloidogyne enterolobii TaxID=390850 RepID=A0ACB0Z4U5_MELEN
MEEFGHNYINKNQNFTHLFTFHIMPIKAMGQSLQNSWGSCKINGTKPGCTKEARLLKCDKMFIRFDKEHFKILVHDVPVAKNSSSTVGNKNLEFSTTQNIDRINNEDTTTDDNVKITRIPTSTESSGMSTITIVLFISGVVVLIFASIVCVLICILFRKEDKEEEENGQSKQEESQGSYIRSTHSTPKNSLKESNVDVELPPLPAIEDEKQKEEKHFNDASTVVETQYHQEFNDVDCCDYTDQIIKTSPISSLSILCQ